MKNATATIEVAPIQLMKFYATNGTAKVKVWYSRGSVLVGTERQDCVTIYAKDYNDRMTPVFGEAVQNGTDMMTDYFEKDKVRIFPSNPLWAEACDRAERKA